MTDVTVPERHPFPVEPKRQAWEGLADAPAAPAIAALEGFSLEDSALLGEALTAAARTRFPSLSEMDPRQKINALENHTVLTAQIEADLSRLRLIAQRKLQDAEDEWEAVAGWEAHLRRPRDTTAADRNRAKAKIAPELWAMIRACRFLIPRCSEEIERMERDTKRASRIYSFITGS